MPRQIQTTALTPNAEKISANLQWGTLRLHSSFASKPLFKYRSTYTFYLVIISTLQNSKEQTLHTLMEENNYMQKHAIVHFLRPKSLNSMENTINSQISTMRRERK